MTDDEAETENEAIANGASVEHFVEGPPGLGAWLSQSQDEHNGYSRLEWNESCGSRRRMCRSLHAERVQDLIDIVSLSIHSEYQLHESVPPKKIFNATVQEDVRDGRAPRFSLHKLYTGVRGVFGQSSCHQNPTELFSCHLIQTDFIETRDFDAHIPHHDLLQVVLDDAQEQEERRIFPGSALCAEVGVLPIGEHAVTRFYTVGTVTGRRANDFSEFLTHSAAARAWLTPKV